MSKPTLRPSPRTRATGEGDIAHTINRGGLQPCSTCKQHNHAHLVLAEGHCRTWAVFCEEHCPVCIEARAARLRALLTVFQPAEDANALSDVVEAA